MCQFEFSAPDPLRKFAAGNCDHSKLGVSPGLRETVIENKFREAFSGVCKASAGAGKSLSKTFVFERLALDFSAAPKKGKLHRPSVQFRFGRSQ